MVVATEPKVEAPVQYVSCPAVGVEVVENLPLYRVVPSYPSSVPVQSPVASRESTPAAESERPEPLTSVRKSEPILI